MVGSINWKTVESRRNEDSKNSSPVNKTVTEVPRSPIDETIITQIQNIGIQNKTFLQSIQTILNSRPQDKLLFEQAHSVSLIPPRENSFTLPTTTKPKPYEDFIALYSNSVLASLNENPDYLNKSIASLKNRGITVLGNNERVIAIHLAIDKLINGWGSGSFTQEDISEKRGVLIAPFRQLDVNTGRSSEFKVGDQFFSYDGIAKLLSEREKQEKIIQSALKEFPEIIKPKDFPRLSLQMPLSDIRPAINESAIENNVNSTSKTIFFKLLQSQKDKFLNSLATKYPKKAAREAIFNELMSQYQGPDSPSTTPRKKTFTNLGHGRIFFDVESYINDSDKTTYSWNFDNLVKYVLFEKEESETPLNIQQP